MPAGGVTRALASVRRENWYPRVGRAPILLWRAGLGPVIGLAFAIVSATGRKTGRPQHNLVTYRDLRGRTFLTGLYGRESDWYRNLQADPRVTLQTAWRTRAMLAYPLTDDVDLLEALDFLRRHAPIFVRLYLWSLGIGSDPADVLDKRDRTMFVELRETDEPTPPPVKVDLLWVWPLAAAAWLLVRRLRRR